MYNTPGIQLASVFSFLFCLSSVNNKMQMDFELLYAQVIAEAKIHAQMNSADKGRGGISWKNEAFHCRLTRSRSTSNPSPSPSLSPKLRKSWKNCLLFWRMGKTRSGCIDKHPAITRRSKLCFSAPMATTNEQETEEDPNEIEIGISKSGFGWLRKKRRSYISGGLSPARFQYESQSECESDIPYLRLNQNQNTYSASRFLRETKPAIHFLVQDW
ncbi:hypothetical protein KI387_024293 [Taxus chinensis]|uniref:Uncharacterized protein n=1 Tax=Taxus chinensis TaxID=29808 RepID=A0AA38L8S6_TAXCH|nr:hypothetical protein KI387_024293 [Taxus chinensis]